MKLCPACGHLIVGPGAICSHHTATPLRDDWARGNRIMCDFVHRGIAARAAPPSPARSPGTAQGAFRSDTVACSTRPWPSRPLNEESISPQRVSTFPVSS